MVLAMAVISTFLWLSGGLLGVTVERVNAEVPGHPDVPPSLQAILNKAHQAPLYTYPTSFTQGIIPVCFF
jgi:hypothetical protein